MASMYLYANIMGLKLSNFESRESHVVRNVEDENFSHHESRDED